MKHRILIVTGIVAATAALSIGPAVAAPGDNGNGVGGCSAGVFYGNTTNPRPSGNGVLPSQSPGPWLNNPTDPDNPVEGSSIGDYHKLANEIAGPSAFTGRQLHELFCLGD